MKESQTACQQRICQTKPQNLASQSLVCHSPWWSLGKSTYKEASSHTELGQKPTEEFLTVKRSQWASKPCLGTRKIYRHLLPSCCPKLLNLSQRNRKLSYKFSWCREDRGIYFLTQDNHRTKASLTCEDQTLWRAATCWLPSLNSSNAPKC